MLLISKSLSLFYFRMSNSKCVVPEFEVKITQGRFWSKESPNSFDIELGQFGAPALLGKIREKDGVVYINIPDGTSKNLYDVILQMMCRYLGRWAVRKSADACMNYFNVFDIRPIEEFGEDPLYTTPNGWKMTPATFKLLMVNQKLLSIFETAWASEVNEIDLEFPSEHMGFIATQGDTTRGNVVLFVRKNTFPFGPSNTTCATIKKSANPANRFLQFNETVFDKDTFFKVMKHNKCYYEIMGNSLKINVGSQEAVIAMLFGASVKPSFALVEKYEPRSVSAPVSAPVVAPVIIAIAKPSSMELIAKIVEQNPETSTPEEVITADVPVQQVTAVAIQETIHKKNIIDDGPAKEASVSGKMAQDISDIYQKYFAMPNFTQLLHMMSSLIVTAEPHHLPQILADIVKMRSIIDTVGGNLEDQTLHNIHRAAIEYASSK